MLLHPGQRATRGLTEWGGGSAPLRLRAFMPLRRGLPVRARGELLRELGPLSWWCKKSPTL
jgi:hypothetical protein